MKIEGKGPAEAPEGGRFSAARALLKEGGKSFAAELKKAAAPTSSPVQQPSTETVSKSESFSVPQPSTTAPVSSSKLENAGPAKTNGKANSKTESATFEDHMALVKLRVQSGFYTSKTVDDALSDRLTGFFDELA